MLERLQAHSTTPGASIGSALCATCVEVLELPGAGISLHPPSGQVFSLASSDSVMAELEELERTLGEGPCVDAFVTGLPVAEPDLANPDSPWLAFSGPARKAGARAAFGFPLQASGTRIGALNLYAARPGPLTDAQHADADLLADVTAHAVLSRSSFPFPGGLSLGVDDIGTDQIEIHQATGMVSVQLSGSTSDALARLRAHAYVEDRPIASVAADVVARRLRFDP